jgi:tetratricopeptide (TPR) repeat protein
VVRRRRISKKPFDSQGEELLPTTYPFLDFVQKYRLHLIVGTVFVLLCVGGFFGWRYETGKKEKEASILFHQAYSVYQGWLKGETTAEESLQLFQPLTQKYSGTGSGMLGLFYVGNCHYAMKSFDDAITAYERFLERVPPETQLALLAYDSLGYCYEEKKDFAKAIEYFQKTISPAPGLGENGYLNVARCYEGQSDTENSLQFYEKFLSEFPESERVQFVREKIKRLNSKS